MGKTTEGMACGSSVYGEVWVVIVAIVAGMMLAWKERRTLPITNDDNDDDEEGGERRGRGRRRERMRDKKGVIFPNKWASLDLVAELIRPCRNDLRGTCPLALSRRLDNH